MSLKGGIDGRPRVLEEQLADRDAEEAVELALKSGKITPGTEGWAKDYPSRARRGSVVPLRKRPRSSPERDRGRRGAGTRAKSPTRRRCSFVSSSA